MAKKFNLRVYGILTDKGAVLVSDEYIKKNKITKFPGGGLEFGEGTIECLRREFREELSLEVEVTSHFYTTDFYVASSFDTNSQVISIYYLVKPLSQFNFATSDTPHNYEVKEGAQSLRWIPLSQLKESDLSLVIDRKVCEMLLKQFTNQEANV
jgi:ADP-ribose pyrophosphatase YjhB (NUDIX family)